MEVWGTRGALWKFRATWDFMEVRVRGSLGLSGSLGLELCQGFW